MGGFERFHSEDTDNAEKQRQWGDVVKGVEEQRKEKMKNLTTEFTKSLKIYPILSGKISEIINKHQELINKGEEKPIVCLSEIINNTRNYLKQFDGDIYRQMEKTKFFERYKECINEIIENLNVAEYGEFFLNLRDTITEEIKNPENKGNKREGEFKFVPLVDDPEDPKWYPMFKFDWIFTQTQ